MSSSKTRMGMAWRAVAIAGSVLALSLAGSGCRTTTEPVTGRGQRIWTSPAAEAQLGLEAWTELRKQEKLSTDAAKIAAVQRVGHAISQVVHQPDFQWEFQVFANDQANAFCLPGGKVGVNEGLFKFAANDAELATVIGHEVGHAVARHGGERMTQALWVNLGAVGVSLATQQQSSSSRAAWMAAYMSGSSAGFLLPYSRIHEYAADELGLIYMAKAGYDPHAALSFWSKFGKQSKMPDILEFLSTHPLGEKRLQRMQAKIPLAMRSYETAPIQHGLGQTYGEPAGTAPTQ